MRPHQIAIDARAVDLRGGVAMRPASRPSASLAASLARAHFRGSSPRPTLPAVCLIELQPCLLSRRLMCQSRADHLSIIR